MYTIVYRRDGENASERKKMNLLSSLILGEGDLFFEGGICSRHHLEAGNANFWATSPNLATVFRRKILYFDDEIRSRHHIEVSNLLF